MLDQGSELARIRRERRLTQREVANAVGVTDQTISNLERGETRPTFDLALALARYFGVPVEGLFMPESSTADVEGDGEKNGPATATAPTASPVAPMPRDGRSTNGGVAK